MSEEEKRHGDCNYCVYSAVNEEEFPCSVCEFLGNGIYDLWKYDNWNEGRSYYD